jgi:hypothetical protein
MQMVVRFRGGTPLARGPKSRVHVASTHMYYADAAAQRVHIGLLGDWRAPDPRGNQATRGRPLARFLVSVPRSLRSRQGELHGEQGQVTRARVSKVRRRLLGHPALVHRAHRFPPRRHGQKRRAESAARRARAGEAGGWRLSVLRGWRDESEHDWKFERNRNQRNCARTF